MTCGLLQPRSMEDNSEDSEQWKPWREVFLENPKPIPLLCHLLSLRSHFSTLGLLPADGCARGQQTRAIKKKYTQSPRGLWGPFIFGFPITARHGWPGMEPGYQQWVTSRHPQLCGFLLSGENVKCAADNLVILTTAIRRAEPWLWVCHGDYRARRGESSHVVWNKRWVFVSASFEPQHRL